MKYYIRCLLLISLIFCLQGCVPSQISRSAQQFVNIANQNVKPHHAVAKSPQAPLNLQPELYYTGYSEKYVPLRDKLAAGDCDSLLQVMDEEENALLAKGKDDEALASKLRLVGLMERASLSLQLGEPDKALRYCNLGEALIDDRSSESYLKGGLSSIWGVTTDFLGAGEYGRYNPPGYEKVLLLDLASMAYLLKGDDRAFNVARLAIEWQDDEKEKFAKDIEDKLDKADSEKKAESEKQQENSARLLSALHNEFAKYDRAALSVPNAFVNPFGDYVTGMVDEFKSKNLKSLLSNAEIAYSQALKLNPGSKVLQQAVKDTKARKSANRLIHIVALDGFVPEKKVLSIPIDHGLDVELVTYNPIPSKVAKIKVLSGGGKTLATLSSVADIEALALRHQKDSLPYIQTMLVASVIRDTMIVAAGERIHRGLGGLVRQVTDSFQEPDTTSWMTLPSSILAGRIYAPKGLKTLKIRSYDKNNKMLAEKTLKLSDGNQHFVLVRSVDKTLYAYPSKTIWSPKNS